VPVCVALRSMAANSGFGVEYNKSIRLSQIIKHRGNKSGMHLLVMGGS